MPFMDGLQLSEAIKKLQPWIKIIILSGHDEFDYAKKAISIGIEDYILKPFTAEDILSSLKKAAEQIDRERTHLSDITRMKEELKSQEKLIQKEFLVNLIHGNVENTNLLQKCQELEIDLMSRYYKIIVSKICSKSDNTKYIETACSLLNSYSNSIEQTISFFHHSNLFVCIVKNNSKEELEENVFRLSESIEHIVSQTSDCIAVTAIGKTVEHLSSISSSYEDAKNIIQKTAVGNQSRIISFDDLSLMNNDFLEIKENDPLVDRLKYALSSDVDNIIQESMHMVHDNPGQFSVFASYLLVDMIISVSKLMEGFGSNLKEIKPEFLQRTFIDNAVSDENTFIQNVKDVLNFALEFRDSKMTGRYGDVILKAKKYIDEHYQDQNTTLSTVAEAVCLSPNHFSTIFSQECKTTFIEYLTNVRIENAKRLIKTTDMKGYDIAYECGFSDPHYFSYIFKKNTGLTPREYKGSN